MTSISSVHLQIEFSQGPLLSLKMHVNLTLNAILFWLMATALVSSISQTLYIGKLLKFLMF